jgi:hypothetical protein
MEKLLLVLVLMGLGVWLLRRPPDFVIALRAGEVKVTGQLSEHVVREIVDHFAHQFADRDGLKVTGRIDRSGIHRLKIVGARSRGEEQMIRNYLMVIL